ncbi:hypothetical protein YC2023_032016 [Brassica napus]
MKVRGILGPRIVSVILTYPNMISSKSAQAHTNSSFYPIDSRYFCHFQTTFWLQKKNQTLKRRLKQAMSFVFHESTSSPRNYSPVVIHAVHYKQSIRNVRK